jgi:hypothetical protein
MVRCVRQQGAIRHNKPNCLDHSCISAATTTTTTPACNTTVLTTAVKPTLGNPYKPLNLEPPQPTHLHLVQLFQQLLPNLDASPKVNPP